MQSIEHDNGDVCPKKKDKKMKFPSNIICFTLFLHCKINIHSNFSALTMQMKQKWSIRTSSSYPLSYLQYTPVRYLFRSGLLVTEGIIGLMTDSVVWNILGFRYLCLAQFSTIFKLLVEKTRGYRENHRPATNQ